MDKEIPLRTTDFTKIKVIYSPRLTDSFLDHSSFQVFLNDKEIPFEAQLFHNKQTNETELILVLLTKELDKIVK